MLKKMFELNEHNMLLKYVNSLNIVVEDSLERYEGFVTLWNR